MPIFEYRCSNCDTKFEVLHKSTTKQDEVNCPKCNSLDNKKLLSAFNSSITSASNLSLGECNSGQCQTPVSGCSSGMCGLN